MEHDEEETGPLPVMEVDESLLNEVDVINSIYEEDTLKPTSPDPNVFLLSLPSAPVTLIIRFPPRYPLEPPVIQGIYGIGSEAPKGYGAYVVEKAREVLERSWKEGEVVVYNLILDLGFLLREKELVKKDGEVKKPASLREGETSDVEKEEPEAPSTAVLDPPPKWSLSEPVTEKKSVFLGRAVAVTSKEQVSSYMDHLLATDKKAAKATHNITAYIIHTVPGPGESSIRVLHDCDDDGETAAGGRLAHLLQTTRVKNVLVVVSRWYGGVKLGPDRFRIISQVAREALVAGGWIGAGPQGQATNH